MSAPLPAFRAGLEAIQSEHEGAPVVILRDVEGLREEPAVLTLPGFLIATLLDGRRTETDLRSEVTRMTGQVLTEPEIRRLLSELEQADLLETPALGMKRAAVLDAFRRSDVRKPAHMGGVYPSSIMDLAAMLGAYFRDPKGPGREFAASPLVAAPAGVVAPHIDFFRGGPAYAWAYQALSESRPPDVVLALGVAHMSPPSPWVFTRKAFETPYGPVGVDSALYDALAACLWYDPLADEPVHRLGAFA